MSVFTNPASASADQADAYVRALHDLLGDRDPRTVLAATPDALADSVAGLSEEALSRREAPGRWAVRHVVRHLADAEIAWGWRMRMILAHDRPPLTGYDQDAWADRLRYDDADLSETLDEFRVLRRGHLRLLDRASPAELRRVGVHSERGEESVAGLMRLNAGHDLLHLRQIDRIRQSL